MPLSHKRLFLIPLDARPVCYDLPQRLARSAGLELNMPSPKLLGHLKQPANFKTLDRWLKNHLFENDPVIAALDTLAYGGLIASRVNTDSLEKIEERLDRFFSYIKASSLFGFSSILRIPAYNNDEEEPEYWAQYGKALYDYSYRLHEYGQADASAIPGYVLDDFISRREKNFKLNERFLKRLQDGQLDYLTFCQDDTGAFGLNVQEARQLNALIQKKKLGDQTHIQTGADEVACVMLARWMALQQEKPVRIYPYYSSEAGKDLIARFDGIPIAQVVEQAIRACGATLAKKPADADLWLMVHTPESRQGDHCSGIPAVTQPGQLAEVAKIFRKSLDSGKPIAIADVAYANGGDSKLMELLLSQFEDLTSLYGYAGWNTPGNAIGTSVSMAVVRLIAEREGAFDALEFSKLLLIRLGDDWLYQADIRQQLRLAHPQNGKPLNQADTERLNLLMANGLSLIKARLGLEAQPTRCTFPCQRYFEVEIALP